MAYHKLTVFFLNVFFLVTLSGCGATLLTYNPTINPNALDAMQSIRKLILSQPEGRSPSSVYVTDTYIKIKGEFEGDKSVGDGDSASIRYSSISQMTLHNKNQWFMVSLIGNNRKLFRYHTHNEGDAKRLMDSFHTMMEYKANPYRPVILENQPEIK